MVIWLHMYVWCVQYPCMYVCITWGAAVAENFGGPSQTLGYHSQSKHNGVFTLLHSSLLSGLGRTCVSLT